MISISSPSHDYHRLVSDRQMCALCPKMVNPSSIACGRWDVDHIGQWTAWQGSLTADVIVVGQDWGGTTQFEKSHGKEPVGNPTNETLRRLLAHVDIEIDPPEIAGGKQIVFLTNAVLCLKPGSLSAKLPPDAVVKCGEFLKRTIEVVKPKVVVTLGGIPLRSVLRLYPRALDHLRHRFSTMAKAITLNDAPELSSGTRLLPVYHPGRRGQMSRPLAAQLNDWLRLKRIV